MLTRRRILSLERACLAISPVIKARPFSLLEAPSQQANLTLRHELSSPHDHLPHQHNDPYDDTCISWVETESARAVPYIPWDSVGRIGPRSQGPATRLNLTPSRAAIRKSLSSITASPRPVTSIPSSSDHRCISLDTSRPFVRSFHVHANIVIPQGSRHPITFVPKLTNIKTFTTCISHTPPSRKTSPPFEQAASACRARNRYLTVGSQLRRPLTKTPSSFRRDCAEQRHHEGSQFQHPQCQQGFGRYHNSLV